MSSFEKNLFYLILLFLPVNLAKHFIFDFAYIDGILVDYLIPTVYLTDILIWVILGFWVFRGIRRAGFSILTTKPFSHLTIFSCGLLLVSGLSVLGAVNQPAAFYKWLKLLEYLLFSFYVSQNIDFQKDFSTIVTLLSIGILFEAFLAIAQWLNQGSIFSYWFFGENKYTISTPGIASFDFAGVKKVRPYGTFPHPNVLGGYLAIVLVWVLYKGIKGVRGIKDKGFYFLTLVLGLTALYLSSSRSAWVVGVIGLLLAGGLGLRGGLASFLLTPFSSLFATLSIVRRAELNWIALQMIGDQPLLGVGLNNFAVRMDEYGRVSGWVRFLQPVHNLYLLIGAEIGFFGLLLFVSLLFTIYYLFLRNRGWGTLQPLLLVSITQIVLLGFVDHYFWTIQQTSLLFWLIVGLVFSCRFKYNQSRR